MRSSTTLMRSGTLLALAALAAGSASAQTKPLPIKYSGPPTVAAITAGDLMTRLYIYADDSLMGRRVGTEYNTRATAYLEAQVRKLGLKPAGDDGFFQSIGLVARAFDTTASTLTVDGVAYKPGTDFVGSTGGVQHAVAAAGVVVWGSVLDTTGNPTADQYNGKWVVIRGINGLPAGFDQAAFVKSAGFARYQAMLQSSAVVGRITISPTEQLNPALVKNMVNPAGASRTVKEAAPVALTVTSKVGDAIFGPGSATAVPGTMGKNVAADIRFIDSPRGGRNVIAVLPGSDPKLKGQYVVIGAHNDHIGFNNRPVDHDSMKVWLKHARPQGADGSGKTLSAEDWTAINAEIAELRKLNPPRPDSISNGADDDGSGSVTLLELAEAFAKGAAKPKRSILFIWQTGEESGMWGSGYFMDHPTVPRDSLVADLNIDMVGRGAPSDVTGQQKEGGLLAGADRYVQLVGSRRLSTELGDIVENVNKDPKYNFKLDYAMDANGHPQNIYCRSDHWSYGKWGVPAVFFTTGGHADYHQVTDEPQYIRYDHMALLGHLIFDSAMRVANLDHRVLVDGVKPNPAPATACQQ
ncbi:MAG: M20/M25/M40 family metallo-hydrolase [Gemmatimonadota bacterium]